MPRVPADGGVTLTQRFTLTQQVVRNARDAPGRLYSPSSALPPLRWQARQFDLVLMSARANLRGEISLCCHFHQGRLVRDRQDRRLAA